MCVCVCACAVVWITVCVFATAAGQPLTTLINIKTAINLAPVEPPGRLWPSVRLAELSTVLAFN